MHGLALNVNPDLDYFRRISPCGITDRGVTSLVQELEHSCDTEEAASFIVRHFDEVFGAASQTLRGSEAYEYLEGLTRQQHLQENLAAQGNQE